MAASEKECPAVLARITQSAGLLSQRTLTLLPDRLQVEERTPAKRTRWFVYLAALKDEPDLRAMAGRTEIVFGTVLAAIWLMVALLLTSGRGEGTVWFIVAATAILGVPALAALGFGVHGLFQGRVHVLAYGDDSHGNQVPMVWLHPAQPSPREADEFLGALRSAQRMATDSIEQRQLLHVLGYPSQADAVEQFGKLKADGILTEEEFALVKAKLLGIGREPIGFR